MPHSEATERMREWRDCLRAEPDAARRILGAFIEGCLILTPQIDEQGQSSLIKASASLVGLAGANTLVNLASPKGFVLRWKPELTWPGFQVGGVVA